MPIIFEMFTFLFVKELKAMFCSLKIFFNPSKELDQRFFRLTVLTENHMNLKRSASLCLTKFKDFSFKFFKFKILKFFLLKQ